MPYYLRMLLARRGLMDVEQGDAPTGATGGDAVITSNADLDNGETDADDIEALKAKLKATEQEKAELLKDAMKKKSRVKELTDSLSQFGDVTPERVQQLLTAEQERIDAQAEQERQKLESKGEWDKLKAQMVDQHNAEMTNLQQELATTKAQAEALQREILDLTVGASFASSKFLSEQTVLPANKARAFYGDHFDVENGKVVGYDKPRGDDSRTLLVDAKGEPVNFEAAIERIVRADADVESLLRSRQKRGARSDSSEITNPTLTGHKSAADKIASGIAKWANQ